MSNLSPDQMQAFERQLDERERVLQAEVREAKQAQAERPKREGPHAQDQGEDAEERYRVGLEHVDLQRDQEELRFIAEARERIAEGSYGDCIDCGSDIPIERLKAQPIASRCIDCQTKYEHTHQTTPRYTT